MASFLSSVVAKAMGTEPIIPGLGFKFEEICRVNEEDKQQVISRVKELDQSAFSWRFKLRAGAVISHLENRVDEFRDRTREDIVECLARQAEPGDIVFTSPHITEGGFQREIFSLGLRVMSARDALDKVFPFTHVGVVGLNKEVIDIDLDAIKVRSFKEMLIDCQDFDAVAVGRISVPESLRRRIAVAAETFVADKKYNLGWLTGRAVIDLLRVKFLGHDPKDTSASQEECVCVDVLTEPAKRVAEHGHRYGTADDVAKLRAIGEEMTPLELFKNRAVQIVGAASLRRNVGAC